MKNRMKQLTFLLLFTTAILRGQISPLFSIYREQTATLNPAMPSTNYLISEYNNSIAATYRYQWIGVEGAPVTQVLNWECLPTDKNILIGAHITNDKTGEIGLTSVNGQFAYKIALSRTENRILSIGMSAGIQSYYENIGIYAAERNIPLENTRRTIFDLNMGAYYHHDNLFYVGVSTPQLLGNTIFLNATDKTSNYSVQKARQIYAVGGMYIDAPFFGNDGAYLEPNIWLRYLTDARQLSLDVNLRAKVSSSFWFGAGYNLNAKTINIETGSVLSDAIGLDVGQLKIGMGFGIPIGTNVRSLGPIGEVHLCYAWGGK
jgi:type IX secretion system PorP/SprF family membrane protein